MSSVNKVILIGRLGKDPELRTLNNGDAVANASMATSEQWKDKATGDKKEATEWHNLTFYGRLAEVVSQYGRKGSLLYVEGKLKTRKWQDRDGNDRYTTEVHCHEMKLLGSKDDGGGQQRPAAAPAPRPQAGGQQPQRQQRAPTGGHDMDDDVPF